MKGKIIVGYYPYEPTGYYYEIICKRFFIHSENLFKSYNRALKSAKEIADKLKIEIIKVDEK